MLFMFCWLSFSAETPVPTPACFPEVRAIVEGRRFYLENLVSYLTKRPLSQMKLLNFTSEQMLSHYQEKNICIVLYDEILKLMGTQQEHATEILLCLISRLQESFQKVTGTLDEMIYIKQITDLLIADPQYDRRLYRFLRTPIKDLPLQESIFKFVRRIEKLKEIPLYKVLEEAKKKEVVDLNLLTHSFSLMRHHAESVVKKNDQIADQVIEFEKISKSYRRKYRQSFKKDTAVNFVARKQLGEETSRIFYSTTAPFYLNVLKLWPLYLLSIDLNRRCGLLEHFFSAVFDSIKSFHFIKEQEEKEWQKLEKPAKHNCAADKKKQIVAISVEESLDRSDLEEEYQQFFKEIEEDRKRAREELPWNAFLVIPDEVVTEGPVVSLVPKTEKVGTSDPRFKRLQDITQNRVDITKDDVVSALTDFGTLGDNPDGTKTYSIWGESGGFYLGYFTLPSDEPQASSESNWRDNVMDLFVRAGYFGRQPQ